MIKVADHIEDGRRAGLNSPKVQTVVAQGEIAAVISASIALHMTAHSFTCALNPDVDGAKAMLCLY